jgi:hypothetical protein
MKRRSTLPNDTSAEQSVAGPLILAGDAESANPPKIVAEEIEQMGSESESSLTELTDRISPLSRAVLTADSIEDLTQSAWARDVLARCCDKIVEHHKGFLHAQIAGLRHALAAGDYAVVIKSTVGHGNFRAFCESQLSSISFRRIEQFKWLAEHKEELLLLLRAENAKRSAHLSDEDLLAATSIR